MKVKVTEFAGNVVIEVLDKDVGEDFIPAGNGKIGCTLKNTGKHLGMSKEAWNIIKAMKISADDIGEVMTWNINNIHCFAWLGSWSRVVKPDSELANTGAYDIDFIEIPNETSPHIAHRLRSIQNG